jgi:HAD superfamily hydrolase (TIGR01549 family)
MTRKILAVCIDCGDTLIDEGTEEKNDALVSLRAELIPGADELMHELKKLQYPLALVADGPADTFTNNLEPYGLYRLFDAYAISEIVGLSKPDRRMFDYALDQLNINEHDYGKVVMLGNNLSRDIKGANQLGMISVWLDWAPRRSKIPVDSSEVPNYTIKTPLELLNILKELEASE